MYAPTSYLDKFQVAIEAFIDPVLLKIEYFWMSKTKANQVSRILVHFHHHLMISKLVSENNLLRYFYSTQIKIGKFADGTKLWTATIKHNTVDEIEHADE